MSIRTYDQYRALGKMAGLERLQSLPGFGALVAVFNAAEVATMVPQVIRDRDEFMEVVLEKRMLGAMSTIAAHLSPVTLAVNSAALLALSYVHDKQAEQIL